MFDLTIRYQDGDEVKEVTGSLVPADGPFHACIVLGLADGGFFAVKEEAIISLSGPGAVPEIFMVPPEDIARSKEMGRVHLRQEHQAIAERTEGASPVSGFESV